MLNSLFDKLFPVKPLVSPIKAPQAIIPQAPAPAVAPAPVASHAPIQAPKPTPVTPASPAPKYLFDTVQNSQISVRQICDAEGLNYYEKCVIYACIEQESGFINYKPDGQPTIHENIDPKTGKLDSTDWGICQFNDTPGWYIGNGLLFPTVAYVLANPQAAVEAMVKMAIEGELGKWVSYSSGAYEKFLPTTLLGKREANGGRF